MKPFLDRQIVDYKGAVCSPKGSLRVHGILGRLHAKSQGPQSRDKDRILFRHYDGQTDRQTNRQMDVRTHREVTLPIR